MLKSGHGLTGSWARRRDLGDMHLYGPLGDKRQSGDFYQLRIRQKLKLDLLMQAQDSSK